MVKIPKETIKESKHCPINFDNPIKCLDLINELKKMTTVHGKELTLILSAGYENIDAEYEIIREETDEEYNSRVKRIKEREEKLANDRIKRAEREALKGIKKKEDKLNTIKAIMESAGLTIDDLKR